MTDRSHWLTAAEMREDNETTLRTVRVKGANIGPNRIARALRLCKPTTHQPFFDANLRQWQLTVAHLADALSHASPTFSRDLFYKECNK